MASNDYRIKVILIGDAGVGKDDIIRAFADKDNLSYHIGGDVRLKKFRLAGKNIRLAIWDTAGQERFMVINAIHYRDSMGVMIVYDVTNKETFQNIRKRLEHVKKYVAEDTQFILVGNNCHLTDMREVREDEGRNFAMSYGMKFLEVSAEQRVNIDTAFYTLTKDIIPVLDKRMIIDQVLEGEKPIIENEVEPKTWSRWFSSLFGGKTQASKLVPGDIQQDPYALELYERALKNGTETDRSIRINIVGNYRQGKTSLMRRLLGQKVTDVSSTDGIDVVHFKGLRTTDGKLSFKSAEVDKDKSDIVERLISVALASKHEEQKDVPDISQTEIYRGESTLDTTTTTTETTTIYSSAEAKNIRDEVVPSGAKADQQENIRESAIEKEFSSYLENNASFKDKSKKAMLSQKEKNTFTRELSKRKTQTPCKPSETLFDIWDFGGQHIFYATHMLFHSKRAIYLLVFDLSLELSSVVVDEGFPEESDDKDMEYFLNFWMNSIHSFVGSDDGSKPKVVLVGTHRDKVKGNAKEKRHYIEQYFNKVRTSFDGTKLLNHIHFEDFAVDNSIANDGAVMLLRDSIVRLGNAQSETLEIPAKWIQLEKALTDRIHFKIIPFHLVLVIDEQHEVPIGDPEQIKLFLRYHHSKGTFIYYDEEPLSEHVVLEPQYLIDAFKCIITAERFCTNDPEIRPLWKMLQAEGRLEEALIDKQWGKDENKMFMKHKGVLVSFLTKHHIISEATSFDETTQKLFRLGWFVVPSMLKACIPQLEIQQFMDGRRQTRVRFAMLFDNSTIVPMIYHRLMAALIGKWPIAQLGTKTLISKDKCVVRLNMDHAGIAELRHDTIELTVVSLCPTSAVHPQQGDSFRRFSEAFVIHEFSKLERKHEDNTKPYSTRYRCNHEKHNGRGSTKVVDIGELGDKSLIPCPDLMAHDIDFQEARMEWFQDHTAKLFVPNPVLNDKILSKISRCIGHNWQLLGLQLGVGQVQIEQISEDHPHSTAMRIYYMLQAWCRQMADSADMNILIQKMQKCPNVSIQWDEIRNIVDEMK